MRKFAGALDSDTVQLQLPAPEGRQPTDSGHGAQDFTRDSRPGTSDITVTAEQDITQPSSTTRTVGFSVTAEHHGVSWTGSSCRGGGDVV